MFPTSISGSVSLATAASMRDTVAKSIRAGLLKEGALDLRREGDTLRFTGGSQLFEPGLGRQALPAVGESFIEIGGEDSVRIRYDFSTQRLLAVMTAVVGVFTIVMAAMSRSWASIGFFALAWTWMYGMTYVILWFNLSGLVRRLATSEGTGSARCPHCGRIYDPSDYRQDAQRLCEGCGEEM